MKNSRARAYGHVRSILLALATLAIVGVLFGVYQYSRPNSSAAGRRVGPSSDAVSPIDTDAQAPAPDRPMIDIGTDIATSGGSLPKYVSYDPETGDVRFEIYAEQWEPSATKPDTFVFHHPEIRAQTSGGQWIRVFAGRGEMELRRSGSGALRPTSGELHESVRIEIDILSAQERDKLPLDKQNSPDESRLITIEAEHLIFDLTYSTLRTVGPFTVTGVEMQISSSDLNLQYNEVDRRIDHLGTAGGGTIRLSGAEGFAAVPFSGAETTTDETATRTHPVAQDDTIHRRDLLLSDASPSATGPGDQPVGSDHPETSEAAIAGRVDEDGVLLIAVEDESPENERRADTYLARFEDDVRVEQRRGDELVARIASDVLELNFEFGFAQRNAARTGRLTGASGGDKQPEGEAETPKPASELQVAWSGPLNIDWQGSSTDPVVEGASPRMHITASGESVEIVERRARIRCGRASYENDTQRLVLTRSELGPVEIRTEDGSQLVGQRIVFDRANGRGEVTGPGLLTQGAATEVVGAATNASLDSQGVEVRFQNRLVFKLGRQVFVQTDPLSGQTRIIDREFLESAEFDGAVRMTHTDVTVDTDRATVRFRQPAGAGTLRASMEHFAAHGHVVMTHGSERITCQDGLDVIMALDAAGTVTPRSAVAVGSVVILHEGRRIAARQRMQFEFRSVQEEKPPFDLAQAHAIAMASGRDPATVDWEKQRIDYELERSFRPVLSRLRAAGEVEVEDPTRRLTIHADRLDSGFDDQGGIEWALLTGTDQPATVRMGDFEIVGQLLDLNMDEEYVRVPGEGLMRFSALTGLDGRRLDQPADVTITWTDEMEYRGLRNSATFHGDIEATSRRRRASSPNHSAISDSALGRLAIRVGTELLLPHPVATRVSRVVHQNSAASDISQLVKTRFVPADYQTVEESTFNCARRLVIDFADVQPVDAGDDSRKPWGLLTPLVDLIARSGDNAQSGLRFDKEPVSLLAEGDTTLTTATVDAGTGLIRTRNTITAPRLYVDLRTEVMQIEHPGTLLIEDYLADATDKPDARPVLFAPSSSGGTSQTFVSWNDSAQLYYGSGRAEFHGQVELVHLTGSRMLVVRPASATEPDASHGASTRRNKGTSGRRAHLACDRLAFEFSADSKAVAATRGAGQMAIDELHRFEARGHVLFEFRGRTVVAETITYEQQSHLLSIVGSDLMPASIHEARGLVTGEKFTWNLETNERKLVNYTTMRY